MPVLDEYGDPLECLDDHDERKGPCRGDIEYHPSLAGTGARIPRCEKHWEMHLDADEKVREAYGPVDNPIPMPWFDEAYIGERWNPDD